MSSKIKKRDSLGSTDNNDNNAKKKTKKSDEPHDPEQEVTAINEDLVDFFPQSGNTERWSIYLSNFFGSEFNCMNLIDIYNELE